MNLTLQDKIALIYSRAGSQRAVARELGLSHQKVGRLLRAGQEGGYKLNSPILSDLFLNQGINAAFQEHKRETRKRAIAEKLPYDPAAPIYSARMAHSNGVLGDRVEAIHLHWVSDKLRNEWLRRIHKSGKYMGVSVGSVVNLHNYNRLANAVYAGKFRSEEKLNQKISVLFDLAAATGYQFSTPPDKSASSEVREAWRNAEKSRLLDSESKLMRETKNTVIPQRIQTTITKFDPRLPIDMILRDVDSKLAQKHSPAVGDPGTVLADRVLLQVKTVQGADSEFRKTHPFKVKSKPSRASIPGATRKGKTRAKRR